MLSGREDSCSQRQLLEDVITSMPLIKSPTCDSSRHDQFLFLFGNIPLNKIVSDSQGRGLDAMKAGMDNRQGIRNIQERVGLVFRQYLLYPVIISFSFFLVKGAPSLFNQSINFVVFVGYEI